MTNKLTQGFHNLHDVVSKGMNHITQASTGKLGKLLFIPLAIRGNMSLAQVQGFDVLKKTNDDIVIVIKEPGNQSGRDPNSAILSSGPGSDIGNGTQEGAVIGWSDYYAGTKLHHERDGMYPDGTAYRAYRAETANIPVGEFSFHFAGAYSGGTAGITVNCEKKPNNDIIIKSYGPTYGINGGNGNVPVIQLNKPVLDTFTAVDATCNVSGTVMLDMRLPTSSVAIPGEEHLNAGDDAIATLLSQGVEGDTLHATFALDADGNMVAHFSSPEPAGTEIDAVALDLSPEEEELATPETVDLNNTLVNFPDPTVSDSPTNPDSSEVKFGPYSQTVRIQCPVITSSFSTVSGLVLSPDGNGYYTLPANEVAHQVFDKQAVDYDLEYQIVMGTCDKPGNITIPALTPPSAPDATVNADPTNQQDNLHVNMVPGYQYVVSADGSEVVLDADGNAQVSWGESIRTIAITANRVTASGVELTSLPTILHTTNTITSIDQASVSGIEVQGYNTDMNVFFVDGLRAGKYEIMYFDMLGQLTGGITYQSNGDPRQQLPGIPDQGYQGAFSAIITNENDGGVAVMKGSKIGN